MAENQLSKFFNPGKRGRLRWAIFVIILIFLGTALLDAIGADNIIARKIDQGLSAVPIISDARIFPAMTLNSLDNSKRLSWRSIKQIDLTTYGLSYRLGLDLQGGAQLTYDADLSQIPLADRKSALDGTKDVIERRVNALGVSEPIVQTSMSGETPRISVELAGVYDVNSAVKMIGETPLLEFKEENPTAVKLTAEQQKTLDDQNLAIRAQAVNILGQAKQGGDFTALAKQYSEDPGSKDNGGLYQGIKKGQ
ncbi:MAG: peptidylprolyl isomerase, partial [Patescibacteria group bacterium]